MERIIQDLHDTLEEGKRVIATYRQRSTQIDERETNVYKREISVTAREEVLLERESACEGFENAFKLKKDAQALMDGANLRCNAAVEAERALAQHTHVENEKLATLRLNVQKESNNIEKLRKAMDGEVQKRVDDLMGNMGFIKDPKTQQYVKKG